MIDNALVPMKATLSGRKMKNNPKYPPSKKCGLIAGDKVVVRKSFRCFDIQFEEGDILVFDSEMHDIYDSCDCWIFSVASNKIQKKIIMGYEEFRKPKNWMKYLEAISKNND